MKRALPILATLLLILALVQNSFTAQGQTPQPTTDEAEDEAPAPRVVRVSFTEGDVSFLRAGVKDWAEAVENLPLFPGDQVYAGSNSRVELQLGRGNYIRLSENTAFTITELLDTSAQFEVTEGVAIIRLERLATAFQRFEVDTPNAALVLQQDGIYRINVRGDDDSEVIVRRGAAEVSTLDGSFNVREGRRLLVDTTTNGRLEIALDDSRDAWDQWDFDRDTTIDRGSQSLAPDYVTNYETTYSSFYGASDLSTYGTWTSDGDYGYCWRPQVDASWAPYRNGQWLWVPRAGWTWLASEPWGWAPYHYGRWAFSSAFGWVWVPGFGSPFRNRPHWDYRWRPALVYFFDAPSSRGHYIGWYPLAPGERWHRPDWYQRGGHDHLAYPGGRDGRQRPGNGRVGINPPRDHRGITILPVDGFNGSNRGRVRPVAPDNDLKDWIHRGVKPGLPQLETTPVASAPARREGRENRRIAIPTREIINRPVVTRKPPTDAQVGVTVPRVRRLIQPRQPANPIDATSPKRDRNDRNDRGEDRRPKLPTVTPGENQKHDNADRVIRTPRPVPVQPGNGDNTAPDRKAKRDRDDVSLPTPPDKPKDNGSVDNSGADRPARERKPPVYQPLPRERDNPTDAPSKVEERPRERKPREDAPARDAERPKPRQDAPRNIEQPRTEERPKAREHNSDSAPRSERPQPPARTEQPPARTEQPKPAPSENKTQPREDRQQQKEEPRSEPRKKP
jgi:hypothetical protein